jgi:hypothetical protein
MPYHLKETKNNLYYVETNTGHKMSKHPMPKERAEAQLRALYSHMDQDKAMYELAKSHYDQLKEIEKMSGAQSHD